MKTFTRYILRKGKLEKIKVPEKVALKIDEILEEDKEFLEIMEKM